MTLWTIAIPWLLCLWDSPGKDTCPPTGDLPDKGIEPESPSLSHWQMSSLPLVPPGTPSQMYNTVQNGHSYCWTGNGGNCLVGSWETQVDEDSSLVRT